MQGRLHIIRTTTAQRLKTQSPHNIRPITVEAVNVSYNQRMNSGEYNKYIWQRPEWPEWQFDSSRMSELLSTVTLERGRLLGGMQALGFKLAEEATLRVLTEDVIKSSEIEGEKLNPESVRSSLAKRLGM